MKTWSRALPLCDWQSVAVAPWTRLAPGVALAPLNTMSQTLSALQWWRVNLEAKKKCSWCMNIDRNTTWGLKMEISARFLIIKPASAFSVGPLHFFFTGVSLHFLFSVHLHGMTFCFLSDRNPLWTLSNVTSKHFFSPNCRPATFSVPCCGLHPSQVSKLCKLSFVRSECSCVWEPLCVCVCVCVHLELSLWTRFCTLQIL